MGWRDEAVALDEPEQVAAPAWKQMSEPTETLAQPRPAEGPIEAVQAGYQSSATGLAFRGRLPDIVLDPHHAKWYEKALASVGQMASELPEMIGGAAAGGMAGTAAGGPVGAILGSGAGAFAVPAAIRQSLIEAYKSGTADSSGGFLNSVGIVLKQTAKEAAVGAATFGIGGAVARGVGKAIAPAIGESIGIPAAQRIIGGTGTAAEVGTMTVAPAVLDGHLPEPEDFLNAAIVVGAAKGAIHVAGPAVRAMANRIGDVYAKTGIRPEQVVADAKSDPEIAAGLTAETKPGESDIPAAYKPMAASQEAQEAFPGTKAEQVLDRPFASIPETRLPYTLNLKSVTGEEGLRALEARMVEVYTADGKVQTHADTEAKADAVLKDLTGAKVVSDYEPGSAANAVQLKVRGDMLMQSVVDMAKAIKDYNDAKADGTATDQMRADALESINKSAMIQAAFTKGLTETARALEYAKRLKELRNQGDQIKQLVEMYGKDPDKMLKMAGEINTPEGMARIARAAGKITTFEQFVEAWKAGILSGPVTHMANLMGNTTFMAMRPIIDLTAAAIGKVMPGAERVSLAEPFARVLGNIQGAKDALILTGATLRAAYEEGGIKGVAKEIVVGTEAEGPHKAEQFRKAIPGTIGDIIRTPFRALSVADEFFKTMNERGEAYALAVRDALKEPGANILTREFRERVTDLVQNDAKIAEEAQTAGLRFTFNTPLGEKGQAVQNLVRQANLQLLVPFIRTPANIFKEMMRMTPLAPMLKEVRADWEAGGASQAKVMAEIAMGTAISGVVASYVMDGSISGQGSPDAGKRKVSAAAGWQPYSINIGNKWYSYQRLQPLGTLVGMAADLAEVWDQMRGDEPNKAVNMLSVAFANAVTQQTFLQGITSIVQVLADPQRYGPRFVEQYAGSVVPAILAQPTAMYDPVQREVNTMLDAIKARIPGLRQGLLEKRDYLGEPISTKERLATISPIQETTVSDDLVRSEADRLGISAADAPKKVHLGRGSGKLGDVEITPEQRNKFTEISGQKANEILQPIVNGQNWASLPDLVQKRIYTKVFTLAHKQAAAQIFSGEERAALIGNISEKVQQELRP